MFIPPNATKIDLSNRGLTEIPSALYSCRNLKKLNLSNNKLKVIPAQLANLKQLRNLDLSNNELTALYARNFSFPKLETLIIKNNRIKRLPHQIGHLYRLKKLNMSGNSISELPNDMERLAELQVLNIAGNSFVQFPETILNLHKLKTLWLNSNPLAELPVSKMSDALPLLSSVYCFSPVNNSATDAAYQMLQAKKGNAIGQFKLLALKGRANPETRQTDPTRTESMKKSLFISYCHADAEWLQKINVALQAMAYEGLELDPWDDTRLNAGDKWKDEIERAIANADIAVLLVSNNFLASKFIREQEVPPLLKKAEENGARVLPVIVGLCRFTKSVLKDYQAVNKPEKPLNALLPHEQDKIIYDLTLEIDKALGHS